MSRSSRLFTFSHPLPATPEEFRPLLGCRQANLAHDATPMAEARCVLWKPTCCTRLSCRVFRQSAADFAPLFVSRSLLSLVNYIALWFLWSPAVTAQCYLRVQCVRLIYLFINKFRWNKIRQFILTDLFWYLIRIIILTSLLLLKRCVQFAIHPKAAKLLQTHTILLKTFYGPTSKLKKLF